MMSPNFIGGHDRIFEENRMQITDDYLILAYLQVEATVIDCACEIFVYERLLVKVVDERLFMCGSRVQ